MAAKGNFRLRHDCMAFVAFDERAILCSLLESFVVLSVSRPQRWLYKH